MKILDMLINAAGGGLLGLVSQLGLGWFEVWRADKESARKIAEMQALSQIKVEEGRQVAFAAAQHAEAQSTGGYVWAETIKTLWRPFLTLLLLSFLAYVFATSTPEIRADMTGELTACALGAVWFWFGTRYAAGLRSPSSPVLPAGKATK